GRGRRRGGSAVADLMGGEPEEVPERYAEAATSTRSTLAAPGGETPSTCSTASDATGSHLDPCR
ncbi:MAG: hypothetical protein WBQ50_12350, partial [Nocardioides sp.]